MFQIKPRKDPKQILEDAYKKAKYELAKDQGESFLNSLDRKAMEWIKTIASKSEKQKAIVSVLITSLAKKIEDPNQDIRYHKIELPKGYSGRSFDTKYVTPFLKSKEEFKRIAMKESGWLTRSIEQFHPFTLDFPGRIKDTDVKEAFLQILNDVEQKKTDPEKYLIALFIELLHRFAATQTLISKKPRAIEKANIELIASLLKSHFYHEYKLAGASKLPVIAIYSLYQIMMEEVARYQDKKLNPMRSHIAADMRAGGIGDVEVVDKNGNYFEAVEVKHGIRITAAIVSDVYEKIKQYPIKRYYILTTAEPYIEEGEEFKITTLIKRIKEEHGCEVVVNGIMESIKYYLRLIQNLDNFLEKYTTNLRDELSKGTEIKEEHVEVWLNLLESTKTF